VKGKLRKRKESEPLLLSHRQRYHLEESHIMPHDGIEMQLQKRMFGCMKDDRAMPAEQKITAAWLPQVRRNIASAAELR